MVRRHGAVLPRMSLARAAVVDEVEALPLRILEGERRAPRPLADLADRAAGVGEMLAPPGEALLARDPEAGVDDGMRAAPLAPDRPVEEGHIRAGRGGAVAVEEVVCGGIVLVHRLLD